MYSAALFRCHKRPFMKTSRQNPAAKWHLWSDDTIWFDFYMVGMTGCCLANYMQTTSEFGGGVASGNTWTLCTTPSFKRYGAKYSTWKKNKIRFHALAQLKSKVTSKCAYLHPVKLNCLLPEAIEKVVGVLGNLQVLQPLLRRQEESFVAILDIIERKRKGTGYEVRCQMN